jgi:enterochelin esterase-like enzyme
MTDSQGRSEFASLSAVLWIGCGADDLLLAANRRLDETVTSTGIEHEWVETPGYAYTWTLWRVDLRELLPTLFEAD